MVSTFDTIILRIVLIDEIFKRKSNKSDKETLEIIKLIDCRNNNLEFEKKLAYMITGNNEKFPYRNTEDITNFFKVLGYPFLYDGLANKNIWVANILYKTSAKELYTNIIQKGLFDVSYYYKYFDNQKIEYFINKAKEEFKNLIKRSNIQYATINISDCFDLNINTELLFNNDVKTDDEDLNNYMNTAKKYFIEGDKQTAIEKLWDAFENIKTFMIPIREKKPESANKLIELISTDVKKEYFNNEFDELKDIGNNYIKIRHSERYIKTIYDNQTLNYLFFRMFSLLNLCISKIQNQNKDK